MIKLARLGVLAAAVFVLALIVLSIPAQAVAPAVAVALAAFGGAALAAALFYLLQNTAKNADLARQQYSQDVATYTATLEQIYREHFYNSLSLIYDTHRMLGNKTFTYYARWAESIASSKCQRTPNISFSDLAPLTQDIAQMYLNYVQQVVSLFLNTYNNLVAIAQMRYNAGMWGVASLTPDGSILTDYTGNISVQVAHPFLDMGRLDHVEVLAVVGDTTHTIYGPVYSPQTTQRLLDPSITVDRIVFNVVGTLAGGDFAVIFPQIANLLNTFRDFKTIAIDAYSNAVIYCQLVYTAGAAANIPPPSVALPFDLNTYNQLSPEDRYALYIAYINQLAKTNWSQVSSVLPKDVYISNSSGRIRGTLCGGYEAELTACVPDAIVIPVTPTYPINFSVGGYAPLAGTYVIVDPNTGRIIGIVNPSPLPVPQDYSIVWRSADGRQALIEWTDQDTGQTYRGAALDTDGDGTYDEVYPYVQPQEIYQRDPKTGGVSNVNNIVVGPTPTDQWAQNYGLSGPRPMSFLGGLSGLPSWALWAALGFGALLLLVVALRR